MHVHVHKILPRSGNEIHLDLIPQACVRTIRLCGFSTYVFILSFLQKIYEFERPVFLHLCWRGEPGKRLALTNHRR